MDGFGANIFPIAPCFCDVFFSFGKEPRGGEDGQATVGVCERTTEAVFQRLASESAADIGSAVGVVDECGGEDLVVIRVGHWWRFENVWRIAHGSAMPRCF